MRGSKEAVAPLSVKKLDSKVSNFFTLCVFGEKKFAFRVRAVLTLHQQDGKSVFAVRMKEIWLMNIVIRKNGALKLLPATPNR